MSEVPGRSDGMPAPESLRFSNPDDARAQAEPDAAFALATTWMTERQAMLALDANWTITACSRGVELVLGYEPTQLQGRSFDVFFASLPDGNGLIERLKSGARNEPVTEFGWMLRRDGLRMWAEITCVPDVGADGVPLRYCLSARDATLQYRASRALQLQADAAAASTAARNLFLGSVAHELRAALAPITTSAAIMQRQAHPSAMQDNLVRIVGRNAASAARLVEDLLEFSTLSARKFGLRLAPVDLHGLLVDCTESARQDALAGGIELDLQAAAGDAHVQGDADRIRQVITNLLGNAIKFTPSGGRVSVRTSLTAADIAIEVTDTGAGIDPAVLPFIFDPFEQGGGDVMHRHGGFGLGLAISAEIAALHRGQLVASSGGPGQGSTFRLTLPRDSQRLPVAQEGGHPQSLHVLYVEDNADAADAMRYALATIGWSMTHAPSCAKTRELVDNGDGRFDVVLTDLGLPDGSGLDLGLELSRRLPVVAITAYGAPLALEGFADQLIKPAEISEVQRALVRAVSRFRTVAAA